jgi:hypothetical protein
MMTKTEVIDSALADRFSELKGNYQSFAAGLYVCDA